MKSALAILAFSNSTNIQTHFYCISYVSAVIMLCDPPTSPNLSGLKWKHLFCSWFCGLVGGSSASGCRSNSHVPCGSLVLRVATTRGMFFWWRKAGTLETKPYHTRTLKTSGQAWFYYIHFHSIGPKAKVTLKPKFGERNKLCPEWSHGKGGEGRRIIINNILYLLASGPLLLLFLSGRLFHQVHFFTLSRSLLKCYLFRESSLTIPWDRVLEIPISSNTYLALFFFLVLISPGMTYYIYASTLVFGHLPFSMGARALLICLPVPSACGTVQDLKTMLNKY